MSNELTREWVMSLCDSLVLDGYPKAAALLSRTDAALRERAETAEADLNTTLDDLDNCVFKSAAKITGLKQRHAALFAAVKKINKGMICYCGMGETCDKHLLRAALDGDE